MSTDSTQHECCTAGPTSTLSGTIDIAHTVIIAYVIVCPAAVHLRRRDVSGDRRLRLRRRCS